MQFIFLPKVQCKGVCGRPVQTLLLQLCALCKIHLIEGQNMRDQIALCSFYSLLVVVLWNKIWVTYVLCIHKWYYYTSDSLWKIWLVESIQSIHNSLWTWHDKCNICCRYCIYHVKFNVCLVTKPLGVFSSETEWLNVFFCLLFKKCIIKQLLNSVFAWYYELSKPRVCIICLSLWLRQITQTSLLVIHDVMLNLIQ